MTLLFEDPTNVEGPSLKMLVKCADRSPDAPASGWRYLNNILLGPDQFRAFFRANCDSDFEAMKALVDATIDVGDRLYLPPPHYNPQQLLMG